ncbi:MAG: hypothetical protein AABO57_16455 [Acidobacteriota bacterium]
MEAKGNAELISWLMVLIYAATLLVVFFYTRETSKMQRAVAKQADELVHQIRLSIMPAFVLRTAGASLQIRNIGNGVAINVQIDRLFLTPSSNETFTPNILFTRAPFLDRPEWETIKHVEYEGETVRSRPSVHSGYRDLLLRITENTYMLNIRFQDIEGNPYLQEVSMGKEGCNPGPIKPVERLTDHY